MNRETFDELEKRLTAERAWSAAEQRLIAEVGLGEIITIGGAVPEKRDDDPDTGNSIRAELVRWFALGGEEGRRPHEKGVGLAGGWITGALDVQACTLPAPLLLGYCRFDAALTFRDAKTNALNFQGSYLQPEPPEAVCFAGDRLQTEGGVFLRNGFHATGEVRLLRAEIGGTLSCIAGRFENESGKALNADGAKVAGYIFLRNGFRAIGEVNLLGAEIGRNLECDAGRFENAGGEALLADGAKVAGDVFLRNGFHASGEVRLLGAEIGGVLSCIAGRFENAGGKALSADGAKVAGGVFLQDGFHATGEVRLLGAQIGGDLSCIAGRFENVGGSALNASGAKVAGALFLRNQPSGEAGPAPMFTGALYLTNAEVGILCDAEDCWPAPGQLRIDQFRYGRISGSDDKGKAIPTDARRRAKWLHLQPEIYLGADFKSQPWEHLEKVLREQGDELEARRLGVRKELARIEAGKHLFDVTARSWIGRPLQWLLFAIFINPLVRVVYFFYRIFAGYGYFTSRALAFALPLWLAGVWLFHDAWETNAIAPPSPYVLNSADWKACEKSEALKPPARRNVAECWVQTGKMGAKTYAFSSWLYSFDVFLPVLTIEQESFWQPVRGAGPELADTRAFRWLPPPLRDGVRALGKKWGPREKSLALGDVAYFYRIFHEIMGYVLSAFLLAGGARLVREQK